MWLWNIHVGNWQPVAVWSLLLFEGSFETFVDIGERKSTDRWASYSTSEHTYTQTRALHRRSQDFTMEGVHAVGARPGVLGDKSPPVGAGEKPR